MALKAYPLSSPDGKAIPIDLVSPIACSSFAISASPMGAVEALGDMSAAVLEIWSTVDCELSFGSSPVTAGTGVYLLRANDPRLLHTSGLSDLSAIAAASGTVYYNKIDIWDSLGTQYQLDTRE